MRMQSLLAAAVVIVAACSPNLSPSSAPPASPPPSPALAASASTPAVTVAAPTPSASRSSWRTYHAPASTDVSQVIEGAGGAVYVALNDNSGRHAQVVELERDGSVVTGWPATLGQGAIWDLFPLADSSVIAVSGDPSGAGSSYVTLINPDGQVRNGWPQKVPARATPVVAAGDGTMYTSVNIKNGARLFAFGEDGRARPGWPVDLSGGVSANSLMLGPHGWIYAFTGTADASSLAAIRPDGTSAPGWPFTVQGGSLDAIAFEPGGDVVAALSDTIVVLGPDGKSRPGWPKNGYRSIGALAVGPDGGIYAAPAFVNGKVQFQVLAFNPDGTAKVDWRPFLAPSGRWITGLTVVADGTVYATLSHFDGASPDVIVAIGPEGKQLASWSTSADSWGAIPVFAPDGTMYALGSPTSRTTTSSIVAYDEKGPKAGWPQTMPAGGIRLLPRGDGSLIVGINGAAGSQVIAFSADGVPLP